MAVTAHELGASVGNWNALVRRAKMTDRQKLSALLVSSYADADGTGIRCGVSRLAADLGASYVTARRYLAWLRNVGLIELVEPGNRRRQKADVYRLILGPDVLEHLEVTNPDDHKAAGEALREANRQASRQRAKKANQRSPMMSAEPDDQRSPMTGVDTGYAGQDQRSPELSVEPPINAQMGLDQRSPLDEPPPSLRTSPLSTTSPKTSVVDVRTNLAVARATEPESPKLPSRCPHGVKARLRPDGRSSCALCRREEDHPETALAPWPEDHVADVIPLRREAAS